MQRTRVPRGGRRLRSWIPVVLGGATLLAAPIAAQTLDETTASTFEWREIGPAVFGGRITDIALVPDQPFTIFVASASGGLFRTLNNGTTWECIFQNEGTISIGDIAIDPRNSDVIWIGTGEANNQRSSYWGDGVYKTTDGGETWTNLGLRDTHHIGRIVLDPTNPDIAYVAALGHLYSSNEERGVFKTSDGGQTWSKVLYIDENVGVVDIVIDPSNPSTLLAASYERLRRPWHFDGAGPGSGIWKSTDAGATWKRIEGGLPSGDIGRIGLAIYPQNPKIIYATVSNQNAQPREGGEAGVDLGFDGELTESGYQISSVEEGGAAAEAGLQAGDILTRIGETKISDIWSLIRAFSGLQPGTQVEVEVKRGEETLVFTLTVRGGDEPERDMHGIPVRQIGGEVYKSTDGGDTWTKVNDRPVGGSPPYYYGQIRIDPNDENRIYVLSVPVYTSGDGGKTWQQGNLANSVHVDHHALEIGPTDSNRLVLGNDGGLAISYDRGGSWDHYGNLPFAQFYAVGVDMQIPYHVYGGTQDNGTWGGPSIARSAGGIGNTDWYRVGGGDGFYAQVDPTDANIVYGESQFGVVYRLDKSTWQRTGIRPPQREGDEPYRFNWNSPILISHHNPQIIYFGGNRLFKSFNRGDDWPVVSPDLTTADEEKIKGNVPHCTITTIAESPIDPNLLMVGTDDGLVQISEDGGKTWTNLAGRFPNLPGAGWWVSRVELSRHDPDTAYVSFTGYREDDFRPLVYVTTNRGMNWHSIVGNLPHEAINVVREDPRNPDLLYVGTEFGVYASLDRGGHWEELGAGMPTMAVHDLVVHPRDHDLIAATHGRGFFITDIGPLQEMTGDVMPKQAHLFGVEDAYDWHWISNEGWSGDRHFTARNPASGAVISYRLASDVSGDAVSLVIKDAAGNVVRTLEPQTGRGLHRIPWDLRQDPEERDDQQGRRRRGRQGRAVSPGTYIVVLTVNGQEQTQPVRVRRDPFLNSDDTGASGDVDSDPVGEGEFEDAGESLFREVH